MLKQFALLVASLIPLACATTPASLPLDVDGTHALIKLGAPGQIVVRQTFRPRRDSCKTAREALALTVLRHGAGNLVLAVECDAEKGILLTQTANYQPAGEYTLSLPRNRRRSSPEAARILVRYRNADFESSEDGISMGAEFLEPNQKARGEVHYHAGDQTDWIRLKGKGASVSLLFTSSDEGAEAEVFNALPGNSGVRKLGTLPTGKPRSFPLGSDDLLVRVRAKEMSRSSSYTLVRRDSEASRKARVQVVDCYPIGSGMGVAILKVADGIQVNDGVVISASDAGGKRRTLGKCTVTTVNGGDASCELPYTDGAEWVDFRAEGVFSGGRA